MLSDVHLSVFHATYPFSFPLQVFKSLRVHLWPLMTELVLTVIVHSFIRGNKHDIPISVDAVRSFRIRHSNPCPRLLRSLRALEARSLSTPFPLFLEKPAIVHLLFTPRPWESLNIPSEFILRLALCSPSSLRSRLSINPLFVAFQRCSTPPSACACLALPLSVQGFCKVYNFPTNN